MHGYLAEVRRAEEQLVDVADSYHGHEDYEGVLERPERAAGKSQQEQDVPHRKEDAHYHRYTEKQVQRHDYPQELGQVSRYYGGLGHEPVRQDRGPALPSLAHQPGDRMACETYLPREILEEHRHGA